MSTGLRCFRSSGRSFDEMARVALRAPQTVLKYLHDTRDVELRERERLWSRTGIDPDEAEPRAQDRPNADAEPLAEGLVT
ncbi:hypothetical protein ACFWTE_01740 [Nocardiopsis sp. NPDC058631]|uniref:hypothetical protein n=1 Tax=Nocardiopsis sp. NPDC058631 TaxID=3346566 RepID=UPI00364A1D84